MWPSSCAGLPEQAIKYIAGGHAALSGPERDLPDMLSDIKMAKAPFGAFFL